jgi:hypothetical protein
VLLLSRQLIDGLFEEVWAKMIVCVTMDCIVIVESGGKSELLRISKKICGTSRNL